jgi:hypothetical protein
MKTMTRTFILLLGLLWFHAVARAQPDASVLFISSERLTALALGHPHFPQFARVGFGTPAQPWHAWFGGPEMSAIIYLPSYVPGAKTDIDARMLLGNTFKGQRWDNAYAALASFDTDGNGVVEGDELRDLYMWVDFNGDGTLATREEALVSLRKRFAGIDLRTAAKPFEGAARSGLLAPFSLIERRGGRRHLLELKLGETFSSRDRAYLSYTARGAASPDNRNPFTGYWRWSITNAEQWKDATRPWGKEAGGQLLLAANGNQISGLVQYTGPHGDRINLPLDGTLRGTAAQWVSSSPMGLTRSELRLEQVFGRPVLRGTAWSNRNGKIREWRWEATYEKPID